MERDYYRTGEVCTLLGASRPTVIRASEDGEIPGMYWFLKQRRWKRKAVDAYARSLPETRTKRTKRKNSNEV